MVEPVDPLRRWPVQTSSMVRQGLRGLINSGLVQPVDRFGQGVVVGAADRPDRGLDAGFGEPLGGTGSRLQGADSTCRRNTVS